MSISVRKLTGNDVAGYKALRLDGLQSDPKAFGSDHAAEAAVDDEAHRRRLDNGAVFGAFDGRDLIGAVGYYLFGPASMAHRGQVWGMIVSPGARGKGVGAKLLSALVAHARHAGLRQLHLGVGAYNIAAIHLYKRLGFTIYGTEPRALHIDNTDIDEHLMVLFLDKED